MAEAACLCSITSRIQLGGLVWLGVESSEGSFTQVPGTWASGGSDLLHGSSRLLRVPGNKAEAALFSKPSPRSPTASLLPYSICQSSHKPDRNKEQEMGPGPLGKWEFGTYGFWDNQENRGYSLRCTAVLLILTTTLGCRFSYPFPGGER